MDVATYLLRVVGVVVLFVAFIGLGWLVMWRFVLSKMPFFQEIFGAQKKNKTLPADFDKTQRSAATASARKIH